MEIQDKKAPVLAIIGAGKETIAETLLKYKEFYKDLSEDQQIVLLVDRTDVENGIKPKEFGWATVKELQNANEDGRLLDFQKRVEAGQTQKEPIPLINYKDEQLRVVDDTQRIGSGKHSNKRSRDFNKERRKKKQAKQSRKKNR